MEIPSHETRMLCNMRDHILYPTCENIEKGTSDCFSLDDMDIRSVNNNAKRKQPFIGKTRWHSPNSDKHPRRGESNHVYMETLSI